LVEVNNHELVWYRNRVAKLEEQLRGNVDPQLDQKQESQTNEEQSKSAAATPQPGNKKKRKKKTNKVFADSDLGVVDLVMAAKYDLSKIENEQIEDLLKISKAVKRGTKRACGVCDLAFKNEM